MWEFLGLRANCWWSNSKPIMPHTVDEATYNIITIMSHTIWLMMKQFKTGPIVITFLFLKALKISQLLSIGKTLYTNTFILFIRQLNYFYYSSHPLARREMTTPYRINIEIHTMSSNLKGNKLNRKLLLAPTRRSNQCWLRSATENHSLI